MYVCLCKNITDSQIRTAVAEGASSFRELRQTLNLSTQCGKCAVFAREVFEEALSTIDHSLFYPALTRAVA